MTIPGYHMQPAVAGALALWIFAAAIHTMPKPAPMGNAYYLWLYSFLHLVGANLSKIGK